MQSGEDIITDPRRPHESISSTDVSMRDAQRTSTGYSKDIADVLFKRNIVVIDECPVLKTDLLSGCPVSKLSQLESLYLDLGTSHATPPSNDLYDIMMRRMDRALGNDSPIPTFTSAEVNAEKAWQLTKRKFAKFVAFLPARPGQVLPMEALMKRYKGGESWTNLIRFATCAFTISAGGEDVNERHICTFLNSRVKDPDPELRRLLKAGELAPVRLYLNEHGAQAAQPLKPQAPVLAVATETAQAQLDILIQLDPTPMVMAVVAPLVSSGRAVKRDISQIKCYRCEALGHYARDCKARPTQAAPKGQALST